MTEIADLDTPCVVIDMVKVEANLQRAQADADANGYKLRPHIKTHKLPRFAQRALALGATGITVQKLGEAEVMADAGITDIFMPYNVIGAQKLKRLRALNERITFSVTADSPDTVAGYAATFADAQKPLTVGVIYVGPRDDYGYNQAQAQAAAELKKMPGIKVVEEENVPETNAVQKTMQGMIAQDGASLLFPTSFGYFDAHMLAMAAKYPDVRFADCGGMWTEGKHPKNTGSYF
eukprot:gene43715-58251_t